MKSWPDLVTSTNQDLSEITGVFAQQIEPMYDIFTHMQG